MKRTTIFLPEPLRAKLAEKAKERDMSVSELIRRAIEKFLGVK